MLSLQTSAIISPVVYKRLPLRPSKKNVWAYWYHVSFSKCFKLCLFQNWWVFDMSSAAPRKQNILRCQKLFLGGSLTARRIKLSPGPQPSVTPLPYALLLRYGDSDFAFSKRNFQLSVLLVLLCKHKSTFTLKARWRKESQQSLDSPLLNSAVPVWVCWVSRWVTDGCLFCCSFQILSLTLVLLAQRRVLLLKLGSCCCLRLVWNQFNETHTDIDNG